MNFRGSLVPAANFGAQLSWPLIIIGYLFGGAGGTLVKVGILMFCAVVLFHLVTLPVELDACLLYTSYGGYEGRQRIFDWNGIHMDDDTYNASPDSMKAAVKVLCSMACEGRRIAVLADMKELGPDEERFHREVGTFIGGMPVDEVITLGELGAAIARGAAEKNPACVTASFMDKEEMEGYLRSRMKRGDTVLLKGSNSMKLGEVAAHFRED